MSKNEPKAAQTDKKIAPQVQLQAFLGDVTPPGKLAFHQEELDTCSTIILSGGTLSKDCIARATAYSKGEKQLEFGFSHGRNEK